MRLQTVKDVLAVGAIVAVLACAVFIGVRMLQGYGPPALLSAYSQGSVWAMVGITVVCCVLILILVVVALCTKGQVSDDDDDPWGTTVHDFTGLGGPMMPYVPDYAEQVRPREAQVE